MPGTYAKTTDVPVTKTFDEIKRTLQRFGASDFAYAERSSGEVGIQFQIKSLRVLMRMQLPDRESFAFITGRYGEKKRRVDTAIDRDYEQACRQRWRTLSNGIKAKLALVDDGISTLEREFLADIMLPSGDTVGERIIPDIHDSIQRDDLPPLMSGMPSRPRIIELSDRSGT